MATAIAMHEKGDVPSAFRRSKSTGDSILESEVVPVLASAFAQKGLTFVEVKTSLEIALPKPMPKLAAV